MIIRLKEKGLEKIEHEIIVSPPEYYNIYDSLYSIIICRFILGKNIGLNREKELSEKEKEQYLKKIMTLFIGLMAIFILQILQKDILY